MNKEDLIQKIKDRCKHVIVRGGICRSAVGTDKRCHLCNKIISDKEIYSANQYAKYVNLINHK